MKKTIAITLLLIVSASSFSQQNNPSPALTKQDYLKKSKSQKTVAWILLGGGVVMTSTAFAVGMNKIVNDLGCLLCPDQPKSADGEVLFYTGLAAMAGSIPFFISSSKNKKRANNVSAFFKMENRTFIQQQTVAITGYPALSFKIKL